MESRIGSKGKVLVTGGSGFIASHIIDLFLEDEFSVVATARSNEKGRRIIDWASPARQDRLSYVIVEDVAEKGAFDSILKEGSFDYVAHTASPFHYEILDPVKDFLDPAIKGTTGLLKSAKAYAPTLKRVVITSSSAAILDPFNHAKVYDETHWAPWTVRDAQNPETTYLTSKVLSEKAAWQFMETEKPTFGLAVINCTFTYGPVQRNLPRLDAMNTSNVRVRDMIQGKMKNGLPPTALVFTFVDVRDVALAHLRAMTIPEAGGNQFHVVSGNYSSKRIADVIRKAYPELAGRIPGNAPDDLPDDAYGYDNTKSKKVLGLEYISLDKSIKDTVQSILDLSPGL